MRVRSGAATLIALAGSGFFSLAAGERVPEIPRAEFARLHGLIRPQQGESPWREIPWFTSLREARERAAAEGKPLLILTAADGSPLART
jgi:hypothetical protein